MTKVKTKLLKKATTESELSDPRTTAAMAAGFARQQTADELSAQWRDHVQRNTLKCLSAYKRHQQRCRLMKTCKNSPTIPSQIKFLANKLVTTTLKKGDERIERRSRRTRTIDSVLLFPKSI